MGNEIIKQQQSVTVRVKPYVPVNEDIRIASTGVVAQIKEAEISKDYITLTIRPYPTEDAEFEIVEPKRLPPIDNELK